MPSAVEQQTVNCAAVEQKIQEPEKKGFFQKGSDEQKMPSSLTWKPDKPTTPGWYWYRESDFFLEVVHVRYQEKRLAVDYKDGGDLIFFGFVDQLKGEWAGPLEPPS